MTQRMNMYLKMIESWNIANLLLDLRLQFQHLKRYSENREAGWYVLRLHCLHSRQFLDGSITEKRHLSIYLVPIGLI